MATPRGVALSQSPEAGIDAGDLDVWLTYYDEIVDANLLARLQELLSGAEREQGRRFYFADDRQRWLITRAMVRIVLSRYETIAAADWRFRQNEYGRPEIANLGDACDLTFNISHSRGVIALCIARRRAIGIDVENVLAREVSLDMADHFFAPTESAALARVAADRRQDRFFEYWTCKEAYIKARGMGLHIPLDHFQFDYTNDGSVRFTTRPELGDDASRWSFWQFRPRAEYQLALCAERVGPRLPQITFRTIIPTAEPELLDLRAVRISQ